MAAAGACRRSVPVALGEPRTHRQAPLGVSCARRLPTGRARRPRTTLPLGVNYHDESDVARFWRLWTGNKHCRETVTASPRGSVFRRPKDLEKRLARLRRLLPVDALDLPMMCVREPQLLAVEPADVVRNFVRVRLALGEPPLGCDVCKVLTLAPALLLADAPTVARGVEAALRAAGGDAEAARASLEANPLALVDDGDGYKGGSRGGQYNRAVVYQNA